MVFYVQFLGCVLLACVIQVCREADIVSLLQQLLVAKDRVMELWSFTGYWGGRQFLLSSHLKWWCRFPVTLDFCSQLGIRRCLLSYFPALMRISVCIFRRKDGTEII